MYSALKNYWFLELNEWAIFEQNTFSNICLSLSVTQICLAFWKFQNKVFMKRSSDCVASRVGNMKIHIQAIHDQVTYPFKVCFHEKSKHHAQESNWNKLHGLYYFQLQKWKKHEIDVISLSRKGSPQQLKKCMKKGIKSASSAWVDNFWKAVHNCWI